MKCKPSTMRYVWEGELKVLSCALDKDSNECVLALLGGKYACLARQTM